MAGGGGLGEGPRLTLVAGGFGSGKTALVRRLLRHRGGPRIGAALCSEDLAALARGLPPRELCRWDAAGCGSELFLLRSGAAACGRPAAAGGALEAARALLAWLGRGGRLGHLLVELGPGEDPSAAAPLLLASARAARLAADVWTVLALDARALAGGATPDEALLKEADVSVLCNADGADSSPAFLEEYVLRLGGRCRLVHAPLDRRAAAAVLPPVRALPGGGVERGCSWTQTRTCVRVEVPLLPGVPAGELELQVEGRTFRLSARGAGGVQVEGTLFAEVRSPPSRSPDVRDASVGRAVVAALEKRQRGYWPQLWRAAGEEEKLLTILGACGPSELPATAPCFTAYRRRRPFSAARWWRAWSAGDGGPLGTVLRSKGHVWLDSEPLRMHEWSHTVGRPPDVRPGGWWWALLDPAQLAVATSEASGGAAMWKRAEQEWDEAWGDRGQSLLLACQGGAEGAVQALDACLLTDEELADFRRRREAHVVPESRFRSDDVDTGVLRSLGVGAELPSSEDEEASDDDDGPFEAVD